MLRRYTAGVGACFVGVALLAGCGGDGTSGPVPTEVPPVESAFSSTAQALAIPEDVIVCQPGMVDTALTVADVPEWPGPAPSKFMEPNYPSGQCGTLSGPEAKDVYEAALEHPTALLEEGQLEEGEILSGTPGALWASEGVIVWLVVEPQW
jgi:hypothetical protein